MRPSRCRLNSRSLRYLCRTADRCRSRRIAIDSHVRSCRCARVAVGCWTVVARLCGPTSTPEQVRDGDRPRRRLPLKREQTATTAPGPTITGSARRRHRAVHAGAASTPASTPATTPMQKALALSAQHCRPQDDLRRLRCRRWSSAPAEPKKDLLLIRPQRQVAGRARRFATGDAQRRLVLSIGRRRAATTRTRQFALLALHEAERAGVPVNEQDLATGARLLATAAEPRRLVGLSSGRARHRQHDLRRHRLADHRLRRARPAATPRSSATRSTAAARSKTNDAIEHGAALAGAQLLGARQSRRRRRAALAALLPLRPGAGRPPDRPAASSASTTGIAKGPTCWSHSRTTCRAFGRAPASAKTIRTSAPASRCCSSPRDAGRCWSPSSSTARPTTGTITAATWPT